VAEHQFLKLKISDAVFGNAAKIGSLRRYAFPKVGKAAWGGTLASNDCDEYTLAM
jgi:hypothetical protein